MYQKDNQERYWISTPKVEICDDTDCVALQLHDLSPQQTFAPKRSDSSVEANPVLGVTDPGSDM